MKKSFKADEPIGQIDGMPVFLASKIERNRTYPGFLAIGFNCPCGRSHVHGWGGQESFIEPQHRVAHCEPAGELYERGYYIVLQKADAQTPVMTQSA